MEHRLDGRVPHALVLPARRLPAACPPQVGKHDRRARARFDVFFLLQCHRIQTDYPMRSGFWSPVESTGLPTPEIIILLPRA